MFSLEPNATIDFSRLSGSILELFLSSRDIWMSCDHGRWIRERFEEKKYDHVARRRWSRPCNFGFPLKINFWFIEKICKNSFTYELYFLLLLIVVWYIHNSILHHNLVDVYHSFVFYARIYMQKTNQKLKDLNFNHTRYGTKTGCCNNQSSVTSGIRFRSWDEDILSPIWMITFGQHIHIVSLSNSRPRPESLEQFFQQPKTEMR